MSNYGKIAVFAGGASSERDISLKSGKAVYEALKRKKEDAGFVDAEDYTREKIKSSGADVIFLALHGRFGEDGTIQAMLEETRVSYTGSGVEASRLAMDKVASRKLFSADGLKVPPYKAISNKRDALDAAKEFGTPFVVKPQREGSSIGLSVVNDKTRIDEALEAAFSYGDTVLLEEYIRGREITVGILEDRALPAIEIVTKQNIYDFSAKYLDGETEFILPARLSKNDSERVKDSALRAHRVLGCRDFSRVDMRMDREGNIFVLEVNTIPGMTSRSLLPKAARAIGVNFEDLCVILVDLAHKRKGRGHGEA